MKTKAEEDKLGVESGKGFREYPRPPYGSTSKDSQGKAGCYGYDWIDNDLQPSADRILPEHQQLRPGDKILTMPDMGFVVNQIDKPRSTSSACSKTVRPAGASACTPPTQAPPGC